MTSLIDKWVEEDPELKEWNQFVKELGFENLREFVKKNKNKMFHPELMDEISKEAKT